jgi:hypothetical protein
MAVPNYRIGINGSVTARSRLGFVVGKEIELSWEVTNLDTRTFPGGLLTITMAPPNGQYVQFNIPIDPLTPNQTLHIDRIQRGTPITSNVLAAGFTLFFASMQNTNIYSPPTQLIPSERSFHSFLGKSKEEIYALAGLILASTGLIATSIISAIQLLHDFLII